MKFHEIFRGEIFTQPLPIKWFDFHRSAFTAWKSLDPLTHVHLVGSCDWGYVLSTPYGHVTEIVDLIGWQWEVNLDGSWPQSRLLSTRNRLFQLRTVHLHPYWGPTLIFSTKMPFFNDFISSSNFCLNLFGTSSSSFCSGNQLLVSVSCMYLSMFWIQLILNELINVFTRINSTWIRIEFYFLYEITISLRSLNSNVFCFQNNNHINIISLHKSSEWYFAKSSV